MTFTGLAEYKGYSLWIVRDGTSTRLDQSAHGNDYWQTDYDPSTGAWRQTYNVPLDTPADTRRTVILRFARIGALADKIQGADQGAAVSFVSEMAPCRAWTCRRTPTNGPTPRRPAWPRTSPGRPSSGKLASPASNGRSHRSRFGRCRAGQESRWRITRPSRKWSRSPCVRAEWTLTTGNSYWRERSIRYLPTARW